MGTRHCTVKHFNNLIEQDYRHIKRRFAKFAGLQNLRHASRTLKGIKTIHALYKRKSGTSYTLLKLNFLLQLHLIE